MNEVQAKWICTVCEADHLGGWTDSHGVAVCGLCAAPYKIYHYDENNKRIYDRLPEILLNEEGIEIARRYWEETKGKVFPGCYDVGILSGRNSTYSGATREDSRKFYEWYHANVPAQPEENA